MAAPPLVLPAPSSPQRTPGRADSPHSPHQPAPLGSPVLGKGSFGSVNLVRDPQSAALTALKSVRKDAPKRGSVVPYECAKAEAEALRAIGGHPHIVKLLDAYDTDDCYCLVLEYYPGGDMLQHLRKHGALPEPQAASLFKQMLSAVSHMHSKGYIHRDLKLENLFLSADRSRVAVGDFGFAGRWAPGERQSASWGSVHYSSPEICSGKSYEGPEVDAWSLGCCLYGMLHAALPFDAKSIHQTFERIEAGLYAPVRRGLSVDAQNLIMRLLQPNPAHRISVDKALAHPWLRNVVSMTRGGSVPDISRPSHYAELFRPLSAASQLRQGAGLSPSLVPEPPAAAAVPDNGSESDDDDDDDSSASSASSLSSAAASLDDVAAAAAAPASLDLP